MEQRSLVLCPFPASIIQVSATSTRSARNTGLYWLNFTLCPFPYAEVPIPSRFSMWVNRKELKPLGGQDHTSFFLNSFPRHVCLWRAVVKKGKQTLRKQLSKESGFPERIHKIWLLKFIFWCSSVSPLQIEPFLVFSYTIQLSLPRLWEYPHCK